jgi:nitrogen fixation NifU-like protein
MPIDDEEIYQEHILDHYEDPFHRGHLPNATHAHEDNNPLCGDVVRIELELGDDGKIRDAYFSGNGCVISQASASMLLEKMQGHTVEEAKKFSAEDMLKLYGPRLTPNRQKCCLLSWKVLQSAVHSPIEGNGK